MTMSYHDVTTASFDKKKLPIGLDCPNRALSVQSCSLGQADDVNSIQKLGMGSLSDD
jgi:hypothetical protein